MLVFIANQCHTLPSLLPLYLSCTFQQIFLSSPILISQSLFSSAPSLLYVTFWTPLPFALVCFGSFGCLVSLFFFPHTWLPFSTSFACFSSSTRSHNTWPLMVHRWFSLYLNHDFVYTTPSILIIRRSETPSWCSNSNLTLCAEYFNQHEVNTCNTKHVQPWTHFLSFSSNLLFKIFGSMASPSTDHCSRYWPIVHQYPCSIS